MELNVKRARIVGFISIKGGVGKTTSVSNLGYVLSKDFDKKVLVVDGNFSAPNLAMHYGFKDFDYSLVDVVDRKVQLKEAVYSLNNNLDILPMCFEGGKMDSDIFRRYVCSLRSFYDFILIDSSPALNEEMKAVMMASDELFVISTPDYVTLASTLHAVKTAREKRTFISGIILNKIRGKKYELDLKDIEDATGVPVVLLIDDDYKVLEGLNKFRVVSSYKPSSKVSVEYKRLSAALCGLQYEGGFREKFKKLFSKKISKDTINRTVLMKSHY